MQLRPSLSLTSQFGLRGCFIGNGCPPPPPHPQPYRSVQGVDLLARLIWCEMGLTPSKSLWEEKLDTMETWDCLFFLVLLDVPCMRLDAANGFCQLWALTYEQMELLCPSKILKCSPLLLFIIWPSIRLQWDSCHLAAASMSVWADSTSCRLNL